MMTKMSTRVAIFLFSLGLVIAAPGSESQEKERFYSTQLPLRVLHAKLHGLPTEAIDYQAAYNNRVLFDTRGPSKPANDEIRFERAGCLGTCASDSLRLLPGGKAYYWGGEHAPKQGCHTADVPEEAFLVLSELVDEIGFWEMKDTYAVLDTDQASTYTAVRRGEKTKVIWNYACSGPVELWLFEQFLQQMTAEFDWKARKKVNSAARCLGLVSDDPG
jgi:hypothetical protein